MRQIINFEDWKKIQINWTEQLVPIIIEFRGGDDPLDGDGVDSLVDILRLQINLHEGNITEEEYDQELGQNIKDRIYNNKQKIIL